MEVKNYTNEFINVLQIAFEEYVANHADYPGGIYVHPQFLRDGVDLSEELPLHYCGVAIIEDERIPIGEVKLL